MTALDLQPETVLVARGWVVLNDSPLAVVRAEPPQGGIFPEMIARAVVASEQAWVSSTKSRGRQAVRMCITNRRTAPIDGRILAGSLRDLSGSCAIATSATDGA